MGAALCWDGRFATHDMGRAGLYLPIEGLVEDDVHVDSPARITRTRTLVSAAGLDERLLLVAPREATQGELERVHSRDHVERMRAVSAAGAGDAGGGFTPMDATSFELALLSAGSALAAVETVLSGRANAGHAMLRRSGHHASRDTGYGFCVFNNCAVAARAAQADFGLERIAIVDVDAHHGNGTEAIFLSDPGVLTISIHQDRSFPVETGSVETVGDGQARGTNVNVNLPAGTGDPGFLDAVDRIVCPILRQFRPELVIVACGVDASLFDPLSRLGVTAAGFAAVAERLLAVAEESCAGRLVSIQEGGYSHVYAPFCWLAVIETIAELERHPDPYEPFIADQPGCRELEPWQVAANDATLRALASYWRL